MTAGSAICRPPTSSGSANRSGSASHGLRPRDTLLVTPLDRPNLALRLKQGSNVQATHCGMEIAGPAVVFLYLDRPAAFVSALKSSLQG